MRWRRVRLIKYQSSFVKILLFHKQNLKCVFNHMQPKRLNSPSLVKFDLMNKGTGPRIEPFVDGFTVQQALQSSDDLFGQLSVCVMRPFKYTQLACTPNANPFASCTTELRSDSQLTFGNRHSDCLNKYNMTSYHIIYIFVKVCVRVHWKSVVRI